MPSFGETIASLEQSGDDYLVEAREEWGQGRTLFGGMTAALSHESVRRAHGDLGVLRSAQFAFVGPASGSLRFRSALLRQGRSSNIVGGECLNEEGVAARSTFVFGAARESEVAHDFTPRLQVPPPDACEPFHRTKKPLSGFLAQMEFRLASGARLLERDKHPEFAVWTRFREGGAQDPVTSLLALGDALPSAAMVSFPRPGAISTMTWMIDLHRQPGDGSAWHLLWSSSEATSDGYSVQNMRVYDEAGEPIASGRQMVAIFV